MFPSNLNVRFFLDIKLNKILLNITVNIVYPQRAPKKEDMGILTYYIKIHVFIKTFFITESLQL